MFFPEILLQNVICTISSIGFCGLVFFMEIMRSPYTDMKHIIMYFVVSLNTVTCLLCHFYYLL